MRDLVPRRLERRDGELRVGAIQETVTVSAESPIVDIQNTTQQRVFDEQVIEAIPAGRSHINMAVLVPGLAASQPGRGALQDVGGTNNLQNTTFTIHGSRQQDTRLQLDGVRVGNVLSEGQFSNFVPDTGSTAEVTMDTAAHMLTLTLQFQFGGCGHPTVPCGDCGCTPATSPAADPSTSPAADDGQLPDTRTGG